MKKFKNNLKVVALGVSLIFGLCGPLAVNAAGPGKVDLLSAGNFTILAKTGISATGQTVITGDIGVSPAAATFITGFDLTLPVSSAFATSPLIVGKVFTPNYANPTPSNVSSAISDMETAYTSAAGLTNPTATELGAGNIGGLTLSPGLYKWGTGVTIPTDVTLAGGADDVWVFQIAQTLTIGSAAKVVLSGGAQADNIFWVVDGKITIGTTAVLNGNVLGKTAIALNTGAQLNGRALAQTAVTLDSNNVTRPASSAAIISPAVIVAPIAVVAPVITSSVERVPVGQEQEQAPAQAHINNITPVSASVGSIVEISGENFAGFEGDVYFYLERKDGRRVKLPGVIFAQAFDASGSFLTATLAVVEPCQLGETVVQDYSGIPSACDYVKLKPGKYKVYTEPWGKRSNVVYFNIVAKETNTTSNDLPPIVLNLGQQIQTIAANLGKGHRNANVKILQQFLIDQSEDPAALHLARAGATGYFGNLTRAALAEFQAKVGISPAWGNFGPITRAFLGSRYN